MRYSQRWEKTTSEPRVSTGTNKFSGTSRRETKTGASSTTRKPSKLTSSQEYSTNTKCLRRPRSRFYRGATLRRSWISPRDQQLARARLPSSRNQLSFLPSTQLATELTLESFSLPGRRKTRQWRANEWPRILRPRTNPLSIFTSSNQMAVLDHAWSWIKT